MDGAPKGPIFMIIRELNVKPCKSSLLGGSACGGMCAVWLRGAAGFTVRHVWMSASQPTVWLLCIFPRLCVRKRERHHEVSMNGRSRENLSLIVKLFGRNVCIFFFSLTLPHVKFINIFSVISFPFFFFAPRSRFRVRFSCQAGSHRGLNDHGRCTAHQKEQRRWCRVLFFTNFIQKFSI